MLSLACRSEHSSLSLLVSLICPVGHLLPAGEKGEALELAIPIGADQAYVSLVEADQVNVTIETIQQIANVLKVDVIDLFSSP